MRVGGVLPETGWFRVVQTPIAAAWNRAADVGRCAMDGAPRRGAAREYCRNRSPRGGHRDV